MKTVVLLLIAVTLNAQVKAVRPKTEAPKRRALLIGNAAYVTVAKLTGPLNDMADMIAVLGKSGFEVTRIGDATLEAMERAASDFTKSLRSGDVALFFYSGQGVQIDGRNYLLPVDLESASDETQVRYRSFDIKRLAESIEAKDVNLQIVILDTDRDNPFRNTRGVIDPGLAPMSLGRATFIAYGCKPGGVSLEENGHGIFTRELVKVLPTRGLEMKEAFALAGRATRDATSGRQNPWFSYNLYEPFYFVAK